MDLDKVKQDYHFVRDLILNYVWRREVSSNSKLSLQKIYPLRCHEMAYLICRGMRFKEYNSFVEDGIIVSKNMEHSWVLISGTYGRCNGIIIDFMFYHYSFLFKDPRYFDKMLIRRSKENRKSLSLKALDYKLAHGIDDVAFELFGNTLTPDLKKSKLMHLL